MSELKVDTLLSAGFSAEEAAGILESANRLIQRNKVDALSSLAMSIIEVIPVDPRLAVALARKCIGASK